MARREGNVASLRYLPILLTVARALLGEIFSESRLWEKKTPRRRWRGVEVQRAADYREICYLTSKPSFFNSPADILITSMCRPIGVYGLFVESLGTETICSTMSIPLKTWPYTV